MEREWTLVADVSRVSLIRYIKFIFIFEVSKDLGNILRFLRRGKFFLFYFKMLFWGGEV